MRRDGDQPHDGDGPDFDWRQAGAAGPFPSEAEWLTLPPPPFADDFVARTLGALADDAATDDVAHLGEEPSDDERLDADLDLGLSKAQLATFAPDPPSADFVADTLIRLDADRRQRWQEMLARYVAPEPSPRFVQRTLDALAEEHPRRTTNLRGTGAGGPTPRWRRAVALAPWLAAAAAVLWFVLLRNVATPPFELTVADTVAPGYHHADSPTPLPALLAQLAHDEDHDALPTGLADGYWLAAATTGEGR